MEVFSKILGDCIIREEVTGGNLYFKVYLIARGDR